MNLELEKVILLPPKADADADYLFATIKQIDEIKSELNDKISKLKEIELEAESLLLKYYKDKLEENEDYKADLKFGTFSKRKNTKWVYDDEKSIIKQLKQIKPELIKTKEELDKNKFKKTFAVAGDGEVITDDFNIIEGVHVEEEISYSVKVIK